MKRRQRESGLTGIRQSQLPKENTLYLCFELYSNPPMAYAICSIEKSSLFSTKAVLTRRRKQQAPLIKDVWLSKCDDIGLGMGCGKVGSKICFVGGQKPQQKSKEADTLPLYSLHNYDSRVFSYDTATGSSELLPPMQSAKASPLVVEVNGMLYVLAGTPVSAVPKPAFEVFNPTTRSWEELPSPPFLDPCSKFFEDPRYCSCAVMEEKIFVSTSRSSFSFDVNTKEWEPCTWFEYDQAGKLHHHHPCWVDVPCPPGFEWMNRSLQNKNDARCGRPFGFDGMAIPYGDDVLICIVPSERVVVAHRLVDRKVVNTQSLKDLDIPPDSTSTCLANFGEGHLCLVVTVFNHQVSKSTFKPFRISKVIRGKQVVKLEILEGFSYVHKFDLSSIQKMWSVIGCFVM